MKKIFFILTASILIFACGGNESTEKSGDSSKKKENTDEKDTSDLAAVDTLIIQPDYKKPYPEYVSKKEKEKLKLFFNDSLSAEIFAMHSAYDSVTTQKQMLVYYNRLLELRNRLHFHLSDLNSDPDFKTKIELKQGDVEKDEYYDEYRVVLDYMMEELKDIDKYLHGIKITCVAECTEPYYDLILNSFKKKIAETEGEDDDKFFSLIIANYDGDFEPDAMSAKWFEATWDYGGSSRLGEGYHLEFLLATDKLLEEKNIFEDQINLFREDCFSDMSRWKSYMNGKDKILKEVNKVFKQVKLNESQVDELKLRKKELDEFKENDKTGYGLQLNCATGDCIYG